MVMPSSTRLRLVLVSALAAWVTATAAAAAGPPAARGRATPPIAAAASRVPAPAAARPAAVPRAFLPLVGEARPIGDGPLVAFRARDRTLLAIPAPLLERLYFWYVEAARFPESAISTTGNSVAEAVVSLEQRGSRLLVRDRTPAFQKRSASGVPTAEPARVDPRAVARRSIARSTRRRSGRSSWRCRSSPRPRASCWST
jgi:hypothetical protein